MATQTIDITSLLQVWHAGDASAKEKLFAWAYPLLKQRARNILGSQLQAERGFLTATELLHEGYFRIELQRCGYQNRSLDQG